MKIVDRYIIGSILKTAIATLLICALLVIAVELFSRLDAILSKQIPMGKILLLSILGIPQYLMMVASVSFLFATTFFLSQLHSNNELITFYNSGLSFRRVEAPILCLALVVTVLFFAFSETIGIKATITHDALEDEIYGRRSTLDNRNITLTDRENGFIVHASKYIEERNEIQNVVLIRVSPDREILFHLNALSAQYKDDNWKFANASMYEIQTDGTINISHLANTSVEDFKLPPKLFRNVGGNMSTMDYESAKEQLETLKITDKEAYAESATDFYQRLFNVVPLLILMLISCSMNYRFKKNVLLFSVIQSLCTAVVYYVALMLSAIMGKQGMISPLMSVCFPIILIISLTLILNLIGKRNL